MSTDSAQTVITVVFSVLIITDIVGNTRVCVVIIKNQGMRWVIMKKFELLLTSFGLTAIFIDMRFSAINRTSRRSSCVSLPLVDPVTCVLQHRSSDRERKKHFKKTSVCVLLITNKYIYFRVNHKSRLLGFFVSFLYCYQVSKYGLTDRESGDIQYKFILSVNHPWRIEYIYQYCKRGI